MMKKLVTTLALTLALTASPDSAAAQAAASPMDAINQLFEGMRSADPDMVRAVLATDARFAVISSREGPATIRGQSVDGWVGGIANSGGSWDEQIYDVEVQVDGTMASGWVPYTFYLDGEISHCGINSIELLRDAEGWKITQISDTRRREGCPDPHGSV